MAQKYRVQHGIHPYGKNQTTAKHSPLLQTTVREEVKKRGVTMSMIANQFYAQLGFNTPDGANNYFYQIRAGYLYGTSGTPTDPQSKLEVLATLLYSVLDIPKSHPLIKELREITGKFPYPPKD